MAKMEEGVHYSGTVGNVTFYEVNGRTFMRKKSSLSRKRVLKSKEFEKTRKHAADMGRAAQIGSFVYQALPDNMRDRWLYRAITGEAASMLYEGKTEDEVQEVLWKKYIEDTGAEKNPEVLPVSENFVRKNKEANLRLRKHFLERWELQGRPYYYFKRAWDKRKNFNGEKFREIMRMLDRPWNKKALRAKV